jgi:hypothetical protein
MPLCYVMPRVLLCAVKVSALILIMFCHAIGAVMPLCAVKPLVLLCHSVTPPHLKREVDVRFNCLESLERVLGEDPW